MQDLGWCDSPSHIYLIKFNEIVELTASFFSLDILCSIATIHLLSCLYGALSPWLCLVLYSM